MSKKNQPAVASKPAPATSNGSAENRSEIIRQYKAAHADATTSQIVEALKKDGHDVSSSLVSSVLSRGSRGNKVDVNAIKEAATFIKGFKGGIDEARDSIKKVGDFVMSAGSVMEALAALDAYEALAVALK